MVNAETRSVVAMPSLSVQVDPHEVLGTSPGATLQEIREAYHRKAKTHHPDTGGEEWAFRVLLQAYESLSAERVARAARAEARADSARWNQWPGDEDESIYPGASDGPGDPDRVVEVEKLWLRADSGRDWFVLGGGSDDRLFLSCNLNIHWPSSALGEPARAIAGAEGILAQLTEAFRSVEAKTRVVSSSANVEDGRFYGWLSYPNINQAWDAFRLLREALHTRGFRLKQWTRDLTVPRQSR